METQTLITLDVLSEKGISNALDICNEIEARVKETENRQTKKQRIEKLFKIALVHFPYYFDNAAQRASFKKFPHTSRVEPIPNSIEAIRSHKRNRELVECRSIIYYIMRDRLKMQLREIGMEFEGRDHGTIIWNLKTFDALYATDRLFRSIYNEIEADFVKYLR